MLNSDSFRPKPNRFFHIGLVDRYSVRIQRTQEPINLYLLFDDSDGIDSAKSLTNCAEEVVEELLWYHRECYRQTDQFKRAVIWYLDSNRDLNSLEHDGFNFAGFGICESVVNDENEIIQPDQIRIEAIVQIEAEHNRSAVAMLMESFMTILKRNLPIADREKKFIGFRIELETRSFSHGVIRIGKDDPTGVVWSFLETPFWHGFAYMEIAKTSPLEFRRLSDDFSSFVISQMKVVTSTVKKVESQN